MNTFLQLYAPEGDGGSGGGAPPAGGSPSLLSTPPGGTPPAGAPPAGPAGSNTSPAPVVTKPFREGWISADGKIDKSAYDRLPDHLKPHAEFFKRFDTDVDLLQTLAHQSTLIGKKGLMPLPEGASDKDKAEFNARMREILRVPEKPEGYGLKRPDNVPPEAWNDDYANGIAAIAHKHNVPPEAVKEMAVFDAEFATKTRTGTDAQIAQQLQTEKAELQKAWGGEFSKNAALAAQAARTLGLDPEQDPIFANARVVKAFAEMAKMVAPDRLVSGDNAGNNGSSDEQKADDIINNKANPLHEAYVNQSHPQHQHALNTVQSFIQRSMNLKKARSA